MANKTHLAGIINSTQHLIRVDWFKLYVKAKSTRPSVRADLAQPLAMDDST